MKFKTIRPPLHNPDNFPPEVDFDIELQNGNEHISKEEVFNKLSSYAQLNFELDSMIAYVACKANGKVIIEHIQVCFWNGDNITFERCNDESITHHL